MTPESPAELALRCALYQQPSEYDVCTVRQQDVAAVLSSLRELRRSYAERADII
jgi:hypothetical protein